MYNRRNGNKIKSAYIRVAGGLKIGDVTVEVPLEGAPADGFHTGTVVTERLRPISLLLQ